MQIITEIDKEEFTWECTIDNISSKSLQNFTPRSESLINSLPSCGWIIVDDSLDISTQVKGYISIILNKMFAKSFDINYYHKFISNDEHQKFLEFARDLRLSDLSLNSNDICRYFSKILNLKLGHVVDKLERDHVQIRTVRPGMIDFNPPHKDSYINEFTDVVNIWIPIVCDSSSSLPVINHSHTWDEKLIERSDIKSAKMGGNTYNVPAIYRYDSKNLSMTRPPVSVGQALIFTPFLVHGFGVNNSSLTRFALELRLQIR